jgi:hypothetical protein
MASPQVLPAHLQGDALARGIMADPTLAAAVFAHLTYADATPLRAACRGLRGAVAEHPWALPVPPPWWLLYEYTPERNKVRTPAGLARWHAAFPAARTLLLRASASDGAAAALGDVALAPLAGWGLAGLHLEGLHALSPAGLARAVGGAASSLTALSLASSALTPADVAAATAGAPRLAALHLVAARGRVADGHLAGWGGLRVLDLRTRLAGGGGGGGAEASGGPPSLSPAPAHAFTGAGLAALAAVRELTLLLPADVAWVPRAFAPLRHLASLSLLSAASQHPEGASRLAGASRLFEAAPPSLRSVHLGGVALAWAPSGGDGDGGDGGAALLRPLAHVPSVLLTDVAGVGDGGLAALVAGGKTQRLTLFACADVEGAALAPPPPAPGASSNTLAELHVEGCARFTGAGLAALAALQTLDVADCPRFAPHAALAGLAAACPALARVRVSWGGEPAAAPPPPPVDAADALETAFLAGAPTGADGWAFTRDGDRRTWTAQRTPPTHPPH